MLIRSLYAYVGLGRPDLPDAFFGRALQESIREVARRAFCLRSQIPVALPAGQQSAALALPDGQALLRVHRVTLSDGTLLRPASLPDVQESRSIGEPAFWQASRNTLYVAPIPPLEDGDVNLLVEVSWVPTTDLADVDLPDSAIPAVTGLAESRILMLPGEGKDANQAAQHRAEGLSAITRLIWETFHPGPTTAYVEPYPGMP